MKLHDLIAHYLYIELNSFTFLGNLRALAVSSQVHIGPEYGHLLLNGKVAHTHTHKFLTVLFDVMI